MKKSIFFLPLLAVMAVSCTEDAVLTKVELTPAESMVYLKTSKELPQLALVFTPADVVDKSISWSSDSPDIIAVDSNGKLTLVSDKEAVVMITATSANGKKAVSSISVIDNFKELAEAKYGYIDATAELGMYIIDRNLGATEKYVKGGEMNDNAIGHYYQWGKNTPVATGVAAAVTGYDKEWKAEGAGFSNWSDASKTPCPAGWSIPNQAQMKLITDKAWADYDFGSQTDEEFDAAKALYNKLSIARSGYWRIVGVTEADRTAATPDKYLPKAGYLWSSEKNTTLTARGFARAFTLSDNYDIILGKNGNENEVNNALPIRCIKLK